MKNQTHSETFNFGNTTVHIDGVPDVCRHDDAGEWLHFNDDGQYFRDSELPNREFDAAGWIAFMEANKIRGGCCSCSKCGKPFTPDFFSMP